MGPLRAGWGGERRSVDGTVARAAPALAGARGISAASLLLFGLLWVPSLFRVGEFSASFVLPFLIAGWVMLQPAPNASLGRALHGDGKGLWIEALFIAVALLFAALSMTISPVPDRAFRVILPMAYGVCALLILTRVSALAARRIVYAILWSGVLVTAIVLAMSLIPPLRASLSLGYRFKGLFENSNQLALSISAFWPLLVALALTTRVASLRALCLVSLAILATALMISGAKTGLAMSFAATCVMLLYHSSRTGSIDSAFLSLVLAVALIALAIPLLLAILAWVSPITFSKIESIFVGGVRDYHTIEARNRLWAESLRVGLASPMLGEGAGTSVLGKSHSHNMILDYFRGMGVFAMIAAAGLLVMVITRTLAFLGATWGKDREGRTTDSITLALYLGAAGYLIGNQISDSFSPSTAFLFWMVYLCAYRSAQQPAVHVATPVISRPIGWTPRVPVQRPA